MVLAAPQLAPGVSIDPTLTSQSSSDRSARVRRLLVLLLVFLTLVTAVDLALTLAGSLQPANRALTQDAYRLDPGWLSLPMVGFTLLGEDPPLDIIALAVAFLAFRRGRRLDALFMIAVAVVARLLGVALKYVVQQQRPFLHAPPRPLSVLHGYGYPSGHALLSMAVLGFSAFVLARLLDRARLRWLTVAACGALILCIGWSRVYLGFHWVNDVVGGYLYGAVVATIGWLLELYYRSRIGKRRAPSAD